MAGSDIGLNYASAFIETLKGPEAIDGAARDLESLAAVMKKLPALTRVLGHPGMELTRRRTILAEVLDKIDPQPATRRFLQIVLEKGRIAQTAAIAVAFAAMRDARLNQASGEVVTVVPIDAKEQEEWKCALARLSGRTVRVSFRTDSALLGGALARVGSVVYDGSLKKQLEKIRGVLRGEP